ncbi:hypothetical protein M419DRAFT_121896 [Trichoderma reesei RUT C-30]|uniref:Uncharacterized protein n=1 Tax=Hypocrea jecorina (strain ATCC 56765 / BCRC 32924 / NRRL 11460 / Rut C-30) TaxID=1344414 RepID=A0A024SH88_HYPJR|nr:hypothetical protein M419DRAFT_121896 [Trichoderma reesei RUT C-30]
MAAALPACAARAAGSRGHWRAGSVFTIHKCGRHNGMGNANPGMHLVSQAPFGRVSTCESNQTNAVPSKPSPLPIRATPSITSLETQTLEHLHPRRLTISAESCWTRGPWLDMFSAV